jgi:hypothetical protein
MGLVLQCCDRGRDAFEAPFAPQGKQARESRPLHRGRFDRCGGAFFESVDFVDGEMIEAFD